MNKKISAGLSLAIIVIFTITAGAFVWKTNKINYISDLQSSFLKKGIKNNQGNSLKYPTNKSIPDSKEINEGNSLIGKSIYIDEVPNFDNLSLRDLPSLGTHSNFVVGGYYDFGDFIIITGNGRLVVYDKQQKSIIKQNKYFTGWPSDMIISSSALVGNYLYIGVSGNWVGVQPNMTVTPSSVLKIDPQSGIVNKIYFGNSQKEHQLINLQLLSDNNTLWGSSDNEVFKMDTENDKFEFYSLQDLGFPDNRYTNGIYKEGSIKITIWDGTGGAVYDEINSTWNYISSKKFKISSQIYEELSKKIPIKFPYYLEISNKINDKYYLFTNNEIYKLVEHSFPKLHQKLSQQLNEDYGYIVKTYVTKDEKHAIIFKNISGPGVNNNLAERDPIYLINLETGKNNNITERYKNLLPSEQSDKLSEFELNLSSYKIEEAEDNINIIDPKDNLIKATINVSNEKFTLY